MLAIFLSRAAANSIASFLCLLAAAAFPSCVSCASASLFVPARRLTSGCGPSSYSRSSCGLCVCASPGCA
eukprot:12768241-Prorocentrum_lima.AAC.1